MQIKKMIQEKFDEAIVTTKSSLECGITTRFSRFIGT
jgi:hypothetical protein